MQTIFQRGSSTLELELSCLEPAAPGPGQRLDPVSSVPASPPASAAVLQTIRSFAALHTACALPDSDAILLELSCL